MMCVWAALVMQWYHALFESEIGPIDKLNIRLVTLSKGRTHIEATSELLQSYAGSHGRICRNVITLQAAALFVRAQQTSRQP